MGISANRRVYPQIKIGRTDGTTWVDVTSYVKSIDVDTGDVTTVGTQSGGDSVVMTANITFQNPDEGSLHPLDRNSSNNTFGGSYEPLLWSMRTLIYQIAITDGFTQEFGTTQKIDEGIGTGTGTPTIFTTSRFPILINSETFYVNGSPSSNYSIDYDSGQVTTSATGTLTMTYAYYETLFEGYLGDKIKGNDSNTEITVSARDKGKVLQNTFIENTSTQGSSTGLVLGEDVIQDILDAYGLSSITLKSTATTGFAVLPYEVQRQSVWDATQEVATQIGWYLGYRYDIDGETFKYTLLEPPRDKGSSNADWSFVDTTDFYPTPLTLTDRDIRNVVKVSFLNSSGDSTYVSVESSDSIAEFGRKAMEISEGDTSLINTSSEGLTLANAALHDLKDFSADIQMNMPLFPDLQLFDGVNVTHNQIASSAHFFGVNAIKHQLRISQSGIKARTIWTGAATVQGCHKKWIDMQARPGTRGEWTYKIEDAANSGVSLWSEIVDDGGKPQDDATANPTYLSSIAPSGSSYSSGSVWIDSDNGIPHVWDGSSWRGSDWDAIKTDPDAPVDNATKNDLIRQSTMPDPLLYSKGDMWVDSDNGAPYLHDGSTDGSSDTWVRVTWAIISGDTDAPYDNATPNEFDTYPGTVTGGSTFNRIIINHTGFHAYTSTGGTAVIIGSSDGDAWFKGEVWAGNDRVHLSNEGFKAYSSAGTASSDAVVIIGSSDGDAWFKGTVEARDGLILPLRSSAPS